MRQASVLLLDWSPASGMGGTLQRILESVCRLHVQLLPDSTAVSELASHESDFSRIVAGFNPDVIFLVLSLGLLKGAAALFRCIRKEAGEMPVIVGSEAGEPDEMFDLLKLGAADFITPPFQASDVLPRVWRLLDQNCNNVVTLTWSLKQMVGMKQLIGGSPTFVAETRKIPLVAKSDVSVLIGGETGTGKELCARAIHYLSSRASNPFMPVNCGAIPMELVENELFGHERGAFTSASSSQFGLVHEADGGTLFLDEIDCLPLLAQVKLLRFLQEKEYRPLGSTKTHKADVRIIAAANIDFEEAVRTGKFRQDLYYRLNIIPFSLPPLRERLDDIPALARHFLVKFAAEFNKPLTGFTPEAAQKLVGYRWPGNVRELEHVIERAVVLSEQTIIRAADILLPGMDTTSHQETFRQMKIKIITQFEKNYLQGLLVAYEGNITKAAEAAQKNRRAFWQLIRKHQIDVKSIRSISLKGWTSPSSY